MARPSVVRLRFMGWAEGFSYLLLLFVAMPLKYLAGLPVAVKVVGWAHGVLFVLFGLALLAAWIDRRWAFTRVLVLFLSSLVPFGPFLLERGLRDETGK